MARLTTVMMLQLAALRLTPFRSATVESFLSAAFSSLRLEMQGYVALIMDLPSIEQLRTLIAEFLTSLGQRTDS
jgi:hypothetical protein